MDNHNTAVNNTSMASLQPMRQALQLVVAEGATTAEELHTVETPLHVASVKEEEDNATVVRKRGRKRGSKVKCSCCGEEGHNIATCPQKATTLATMGGPLAAENAKLKKQLALLKEGLKKRDREVEMLKFGTEHVIYGIRAMETDYACFSDPVYVGKSTDFRKRAYAHKSENGALRKMQRDGLRGVIFPLRIKWFQADEEEEGRMWVAKWESYYMMLYGQHKYNDKSYNTNSVRTMDMHMMALRKQKMALEALPSEHALRDETRIEDLTRVLDHYKQNKNKTSKK